MHADGHQYTLYNGHKFLLIVITSFMVRLSTIVPLNALIFLCKYGPRKSHLLQPHSLHLEWYPALLRSICVAHLSNHMTNCRGLQAYVNGEGMHLAQRQRHVSSIPLYTRQHRPTNSRQVGSFLQRIFFKFSGAVIVCYGLLTSKQYCKGLPLLQQRKVIESVSLVNSLMLSQ